MESFLNRTDELAALEDQWNRRDGSFYVLYGRRRVGKTELLNHFAEGRRALYFEATKTTERSQLRALSLELAEASGNPIYEQQPLESWEAMLTAIADYASGERTLVVLDEFQYLAAAQAALESALNVWWRKTASKLPLMFVIAGSEVSFFESEILGGQMYGRRTGQQGLEPFEYRSASLFMPGYCAEDKVRAYAVCGGMPYYLEAFDDSKPLEEHILRNILYKDGFLHEEAELLLAQSLTNTETYAAVLQAVAQGNSQTSKVANATGLSDARVSQILKLLERLQLVEQRRPVTSKDTARKTSWAILDGFLNFNYRFVEPYRSRLATRVDAERHLKDLVMPQLDHFVSKPAWEYICRDHMKQAEQAAAAGAWWGKVPVEPKLTEEREVDCVTIDHDAKVTALASCKWTNSPLSEKEEDFLSAMEAHIPNAEDAQRHYFYSRSGFNQKLEELAASAPDRFILVGPDQLY